jgi:membrane protein
VGPPHAKETTLRCGADRFPARIAMNIPYPLTAQKSESLWKLGGLSVRQLTHRVFDEIIANNVFGLAAELAFYFLFALFPLMLILVTLFGMFASQRVELQRQLQGYFADVLPPTAFQLFQAVVNELAAQASGGKLTFGIASALWGVSGGISAMIYSLNLAHHVQESRSWFKVRALALGLSIIISILFLLALFMVLAGSWFVGWLGPALGLHPVIVLAWKASQLPCALLFIAIACSLIYHFGPDLKHRRPWGWVTPGVVVGALIWLAASFGFRLYLHFFNHYSATYGALGGVMVLIMWLYVCGLAYLIGGETNAIIERAAITSLQG